jgi:hypothetical protein
LAVPKIKAKLWIKINSAVPCSRRLKKDNLVTYTRKRATYKQHTHSMQLCAIDTAKLCQKGTQQCKRGKAAVPHTLTITSDTIHPIYTPTHQQPVIMVT